MLVPAVIGGKIMVLNFLLVLFKLLFYVCLLRVVPINNLFLLKSSFLIQYCYEYGVLNEWYTVNNNKVFI